MSPTFPREKRVFVVDNEATIADTLGIILRRAGFMVSTFYDGQTALEHAQQAHPDIVLSDIEMPTMNGFTLAARLREQLPHCRVLLMSGNAFSPNQHSEWRENGSPELEILAKPVHPKVIIRKLTAMAITGNQSTTTFSIEH